MVGGFGNILPWKALGWTGAAKVAPYAAAGIGGYLGGKQLLKWMFPKDYYYNPTPENLARQFGFGQMTPEAAERYKATFGELPKGVSAAAETPVEKTIRARQAAVAAQQKVTAEATKKTQEEQKLEEQGKFPTETPPQGYRWAWDSSNMRYVLEPKSTPTAWEEYGKPPGEGWQFNRASGQWEPPQGWISPYQQSQLDIEQKRMAQDFATQQAQLTWYKEQAAMQQAESERQYKAQLSAQPMSWLKYASYTGEPPAVQPWMQPLSFGDYSGMKTGQQIPGWSGESASQMPELLRPSAQYQARMGPTAYQQYQGYQQARTGAPPEETTFRLQSMAPPGGRYAPLRWAK